MHVEDIDRVAVLGAGSMGHGITEVVAMAGYDVVMRDIEQDIVDEGYGDIEWSLEKLAEKGRLDEDPETVLSRIDTEVDLASAVEDVDFVIEAAPEQMDLKKDIYADIDEMAPDHAILASNTSSLSITEMASATNRPEQVVGTHFFNPPVKMDLVEVIYGEETTDETAECAYEFMEAIDKTPIYVRKDVRGFVVNSVLGPFGDEAAWMVSEDEATIKEADATMVHERGYPMGPFELSDMTGIDIGYHVRKEAGRPIPPIVQEKVDANDLGQKTGKGYYDYEDGDGPGYGPDDVTGEFDWLRIEARMVNEAAKLIGSDVATAEAIDTGMRLGAGFPEGPCRRADKIGLDEVLDKLQSLHEGTEEERYRPADYLVELVNNGHTGEDAGRGFYEYGGEDGEREYRAINVSLSDGLLEIELDRPERLNAINEDIRDELTHALETVDVDAVRCVTIEGAGDRAFSAGADITGFGSLSPTDAMDVTEMYETLNDFPRPTIAKIDGYCLGGGHELALACDLRIATKGSEFGFPEINLGLLPGGGGTQRALRLMGEARAKELIFRGNRISAERAENWGLINRAVDREDFDDVVENFVEDIAGGPPLGLKVAKKVMNEGQDASLPAALAMESQGFGLLISTDDVREGTAAFMEDRDPEFEGK